MTTPHPASPNPAAPPQLEGSEKMLSYEVHFFRPDGTLGLRLLAAAVQGEDVMRSLGKMQSVEFAEVKVFRAVDRVLVRHKPAIPGPDIES